MILAGTALFGSILLANDIFSSTLWAFYAFYALLGLALHGVSPIPYGDLVSRWFDRYRGLALGLMMLGIGLGAMLMPWFAQQLIAIFGWRGTYTRSLEVGSSSSLSLSWQLYLRERRRT